MSRKVVVITGASSGIGAALARRLGADGHILALAARREDALEAVARTAASRALVVPTDVTRREEVERLKDRTLQAFERIDVWVNNAGRGIGRTVMELTDADVDEMITVNLKSALYGMQSVVPHFQARGEGHLVNVSSVLSRAPYATFRSAYSAAKAALNVLTENLAADLRTRYPGIQVSLVLPGLTLTEFRQNALWGTPEPTLPAGAARPQTADEVAGAIASLIDRPRPEAYTSPELGDVVRRYCSAWIS